MFVVVKAARDFVLGNEATLDERQIEAFFACLLYRIVSTESGTSDSSRSSNLVCLINDLVYYSHKREHIAVQRQLDRIVVPGFCYAMDKCGAQDQDKKQKMLKVSN